jgi:metallopeptidase family M12-like protein
MRHALIKMVCIALGLSLMHPTQVPGVEYEKLFSAPSHLVKARLDHYAKLRLKRDRTLLRANIVMLNAGVLMNNAILPSLNGKATRPFVLNLFDDIPAMVLLTKRVKQNTSGSYDLVGYVEGDSESIVVFTFRKGHKKKPNILAGSVLTNGKLYRIESEEGGVHLVFEIDRAKIPNESQSREQVEPQKPSLPQIPPMKIKLSDEFPEMAIVTNRVVKMKGGYLEWRGHLETDAGNTSVILLKEMGDTLKIVGGVIDAEDRAYQLGKDFPKEWAGVLRPRPNMSPIIVNPKKIRPPDKKNFVFLRHYASYFSCQIDVMVAYTREAIEVTGPVNSTQLDKINNEINSAFNSAQLALNASGVNFTLNRVGEPEFRSYFETGSFTYVEDTYIQNILDSLTAGDGSLNDIHGLRDSVGADLVNLWIDSAVDGTNKQSCGVANQMFVLSASAEAQAYSVVPRRGSCIDNRSFVHELAHNMGARHDRKALGYPNSSERDYGYLYDAGPVWGTIMSLTADICPTPCRQFVFSNPNVLINGIKAGISGPASDAADNHWTLNNARDTVSAFRLPAVVPGACASLDVTPPGVPFGLKVQ